VDTYRQSLAGDNRSANLGFGSFVGSYGVKRNINEHGHWRLLGGFLNFKNGATLVLAALWASLMGQLFFLTVGANGDADSGKEIMRATKRGAARGVTPFRIRHFKFLSYLDPFQLPFGKQAIRCPVCHP
jgi:hypothetical protein